MLPTGNAADPYSPNGPAGAPRLVRQRRIRRGWVGIGVLAIVLAALGSATLFRAIGPSQEYLAVARDVPVGAQVVSDDLRVVRLNSSPGLSPVPISDVREVVGAYAAVPLVAGTLVTLDQLTAEPVPGPGEQLVAIALPRDRLPGRMLSAGDPVLLVATSGSGIGNQDPAEAPRTFNGSVHDVQEADGRGDDLVVSLLVDERDGAVVASLAASGRIAITLLPQDES
jgi:hypothetical protein